jgi:Rod binding domain-containing protein
MDAAALAPSLDVLKPAVAAPVAGAGRSPDEIKAVATKFEASFLSVMIGAMFEGVSTEAPFGGGEGEQAFRSFLTEAMAKGVAKRGGVGLSAAVQREMLKMQGAH